jgi:hypothetical protein
MHSAKTRSDEGQTSRSVGGLVQGHCLVNIVNRCQRFSFNPANAARANQPIAINFNLGRLAYWSHPL